MKPTEVVEWDDEIRLQIIMSIEIFRFVPEGIDGKPRGSCAGCGKYIWSEGGFRVPRLAGILCSVECIETALFGGDATNKIPIRAWIV
jgi:hypothetical protein